MAPVSDHQRTGEPEVRDWNNLKLLEWWPLVRAGTGLQAAGLGGLLVWFLTIDGDSPRELWIGPPLCLAGTVLGTVGLVRRLREIRSPDLPNTRHYWFLFAGWALVVLGLALPWYLLA